MDRRSQLRVQTNHRLGLSPGVATLLAILFLLVVLGSAGLVLRTMNAVSRSIGEVDISAASREFVLLQAVDDLKDSLTVYLDHPTPDSLAALNYALDVASYEVKSFNKSVSQTAESTSVVPVDRIENITSRLRRLIEDSSNPWESLHKLGPQIDDIVGNLQNSYANLTFTAVVREEDAVKQFGNLTVVTRLVVILIVASMIFVTAAIWWQRRYMAVLNRTTDEMQSAKSAAEEANRAKSDFLATISHELRTPLNAITGLVYLALSYESDPRLLDYLRKLQGSADVLVRIINEVLDFSKIESRRLELETIAFSLDEVFEGCFAIVGTKAQEKDLELIFQSDAGVPSRLIGDPTRLNQVLINIATNAVKFSDTGDILVSVNLVERSTNSVVLRFSVRDHGIGIAKEEQTKIFDAFSQVSSATDRRRGGTGLGLAISKELVEMMNGSIEVESSPGLGSTFSFTVGFEVPPESIAVAEGEGMDLHGMRALVVDDNENARTGLVHMLETLDIMTKEARSGTDALEIVDSSEPDYFQMFFVDYTMPAMSGVRTIAELRGRPHRIGNAKFVLVTSDARVGTATERDLVDLDAVLVKPVIPVSLHRTLARILGRRAEPADRFERRSSGNGPSVQGNEAHVLVVEDNELNQQIAREILERAGFQVTLAASGTEGLRILESQTFHAVLMDLQMPDMDGREVTRIIRTEYDHPRLPVLAMTASASSEERRRCLEAGMDDFVPKPVLPQELISKLAKWTSAALQTQGPTDVEAFEKATPQSQPSWATKLDWSDALARVGGNAALLKKLLRQFRANHRAASEELQELVHSGNIEAARGRAHSIKGTAGNLGAVSLQKAAAELEKSLSVSSSKESTLVRLADFERELTALLSELDSESFSDE